MARDVLDRYTDWICGDESERAIGPTSSLLLSMGKEIRDLREANERLQPEAVEIASAKSCELAKATGRKEAFTECEYVVGLIGFAEGRTMISQAEVVEAIRRRNEEK